MITGALVLNTLLLVAIFGCILHVKLRVDATIDHANGLMSAVESGNPPEGIRTFASRLFSSAASTFFFGDSDGTIAGFIQNVMLYDFHGLGQQFITFSSKVATAFTAPPAPSAPCQQSNGGPGCASPTILTAANAINSIATKVGTFVDVTTGTQSATPAFSDGIFQLDSILDWVKSQANSTAWSSAGVVCQNFATAFGGVSWYGSFIDSNGNQQTWDIRSDVTKAMTGFNEVCGRIATITP